MNYSQNNEQEVIERLLPGNTGRLLDIGAYYPDKFSNTRALIDRGWQGVLVEPSPEPFRALLHHYAGNPNIELVNCAIVTHASGLRAFYDAGGDAGSSFSAQHRDRWAAAGVPFKKSWVHPLALSVLFETFGYGFDFISLDVESTNWELFSALPFKDLTRLKVICVEHDMQHGAMSEMAAGYGFKQEAFNGENLILAR